MKTGPKFGVIASIAETSPKALLDALLEAELATSIEIRLDSLGSSVKSVLSLLPTSLPSNRPVILTLRSKKQGGSEVIDLPEQLIFWDSLPMNLKALIRSPRSRVFVDWGLDLIRHQHKHLSRLPFPWIKIGASVHCFEKTPENLPTLLGQLEASPARAFLKLVTMAKGTGDVERIQALFANRSNPRPLIAFAMGKLGEDCRRKCLGWGSAATYGYVLGHSLTAPGQLSVNELLADPDIQAALT